MGCIEFEPGGPRRSYAYRATSARVAKWASNQALVIAETCSDLDELSQAANYVMHFDGDPTPLIRLLLNRELVDLGGIADRLEKEPIYLALSDKYGSDTWMIHRVVTGPSEREYVPLDSEILFNVTVAESPLRLDLSYGEIYRFKEDLSQIIPGSILDCLRKLLLERSRGLRMTIAPDMHVGTYIGPPSERDEVATGNAIRQHCLKLETCPVAAP